jgi:hypothetical protein
MFQDVENSPNVCKSVMDILTTKNRCMEYKYEVQQERGQAQSLTFF